MLRGAVASLLLATSVARRATNLENEMALSLDNLEISEMLEEHRAAATREAELELVKDTLNSESEWLSSCPCWNPLTFYNVKVDDCCRRTDAGSSKWKEGEKATCKPVSAIMGIDDSQKACGNFCDSNCWRVPHKDDKGHWAGFLGQKILEVASMGFADGLLDRALQQAQKLALGDKQAFIKVSSIHALHPVGTWHQEVTNTIAVRKQAILDSKDAIIANGLKLSSKDILTKDTLKPLRSDTPLLAAPFAFCGFEHVLLDGNARLKALQAAAAADPELKDMTIEVSLLEFATDRLPLLQQAIGLLWNAYAKEAKTMDEAREKQRLAEYRTFRMNIAKCAGVSQGWWKGSGPCPVVDKDGKQIDTIPKGTLFGSDGTEISGKQWDFKLCGKDAWVRADAPGVVVEFCPNCVDRT